MSELWNGYDLDDNGLPLSHKGTTSPYYGVSEVSGWNGGPAPRWRAAVGIPADLKDMMPSPCTCVMLGDFDDPRDAAYAAMSFQDDQAAGMEQIARKGLWNFRPVGGFPTWEHPAVEFSGSDRVQPVRRTERKPRRARVQEQPLSPQEVLHKAYVQWGKKLAPAQSKLLAATVRPNIPGSGTNEERIAATLALLAGTQLAK